MGRNEQNNTLIQTSVILPHAVLVRRGSALNDNRSHGAEPGVDHGRKERAELDETAPPSHLTSDGARFACAYLVQGGDFADPGHGCPTCIVPSNRSVEYRRW